VLRPAHVVQVKEDDVWLGSSEERGAKDEEKTQRMVALKRRDADFLAGGSETRHRFAWLNPSR